MPPLDATGCVAGLTGEGVGLAEELCAGVQVGEGPDAQAVGGMQLRLEEVTADLLHVHQLEEAGCRQQDLPLQHTHTHTNRPILKAFHEQITECEVIRLVM